MAPVNWPKSRIRVALQNGRGVVGAGVVDQDLRAFAVPNLYIRDGSALPRC